MAWGDPFELVKRPVEDPFAGAVSVQPVVSQAEMAETVEDPFANAVMAETVEDPFANAVMAETDAVPETQINPSDELNFLERVIRDKDKRIGMMAEIKGRHERGEQFGTSTQFQMVGTVGAGFLLDVVGEAIVSGARGIETLDEKYLEGAAKDKFISLAKTVADSELGKMGITAAEGGVEKWNEFKMNHPVAAANIEAGLNIGLIIAPIKGKPKIKRSTLILENAANKLDDLAIKQTARERSVLIDDLSRDPMTGAGGQAKRMDATGRTSETGGLLNKAMIAPTKAEQKIATVLETLDDIKVSNTIQGNLNAVQAGIATESIKLKTILEKIGAPIAHKETIDILKSVIPALEETITITGSPAGTAASLIKKAEQIVRNNPQTSAGLLKSRQQFDRWVTDQKFKAFENNTPTTAFSEADDAVRAALNDLLAAKNPSLAVKDSLVRTRTLYEARTNIRPKSEKMGSNRLYRLWDRVNKILPMRTKAQQVVAALLGVGGLGAASLSALPTSIAIGGGLFLMTGSRIIMSAKAKHALKTLIRGADDAINAATDPHTIRQLRADRAAVLEILESAKPKQETE